MTYDVIIIGGGPAGLTAAIYASRARLKTLLLESMTNLSQITMASDIENYPGCDKVMSGMELIERFKKQAKDFGAELKIGDVTKVIPFKCDKKEGWRVEAASSSFDALSVVVATGARPRELGVPGESKFCGKGVSYCAVCDAPFYKGKNIAVVGGGDTAVEEAMFLTKFADKVTVIHRRDRLRATKILAERAFANKKIEFAWDSVVTEIKGDNSVKSVTLKNVKDEEKRDLECDGVFVMIGYAPNTGFLKGFLDMNEKGYIITEGTRTKKEGIFVAGDARVKILRQVVTAAGDGATAAYNARMYVEELKGTAYK